MLIFKPLVVDLDGTLIHTDMLHETALKMLRDQPWDLLRIPSWLYAGKAVLKSHLALRTDFNPKSLPYNFELLTWLKQEKLRGRSLILCTAADQTIAHSIADHLDMFDEVIASDGNTNLTGKHKANKLVERFGVAGFDYVGNSNADLSVWKQASKAIVVNASVELANKAKQLCEIEKIFPPPIKTLKAWYRLLRVHQWLKNILLFIPLLAAHQFDNQESWMSVLLAFFLLQLVCFCGLYCQRFAGSGKRPATSS
jgi:phosphoserine phosphatase